MKLVTFIHKYLVIWRWKRWFQTASPEIRPLNCYYLNEWKCVENALLRMQWLQQRKQLKQPMPSCIWSVFYYGYRSNHLLVVEVDWSWLVGLYLQNSHAMRNVVESNQLQVLKDLYTKVRNSYELSFLLHNETYSTKEQWGFKPFVM